MLVNIAQRTEANFLARYRRRVPIAGIHGPAAITEDLSSERAPVPPLPKDSPFAV
jgi:hypothetical protein